MWAGEIVAICSDIAALRAAKALGEGAPLPAVHILVSNPDEFEQIVFDLAGCMHILETHVYNKYGEYQWTHKHTRH